MLGFVGSTDPVPTRGQSDHTEACTKAGVAVKMVTGDNILTARAVAKECGIISSNDPNANGIVIEGHEFRAMSPEQRLEVVDKIRVMGRSLPWEGQAGVCAAAEADGPRGGHNRRRHQ